MCRFVIAPCVDIACHKIGTLHSVAPLHSTERMYNDVQLVQTVFPDGVVDSGVVISSVMLACMFRIIQERTFVHELWVSWLKYFVLQFVCHSSWWNEG